MKYDIGSQDFFNNPFPTFKEMRQHDPVYKNVLPNGMVQWIITSYNDCKFLLKEEYLTKDSMIPYSNAKREQLANTNTMKLQQGMLNKDADDHRRLRKLVTPAFRPSMVQTLQAYIEQKANELLDKYMSEGGMDLKADFALVITTQVIAKMLGIPATDINYLVGLISAMLYQVASNSDIPEKMTNSYEANALVDYFDILIKEKTNHAEDDVISNLLKIQLDGDKLNLNELYSMINILLIAGYETTANLIPNSMLAFFTHLDQWQLLQQQQPALLDLAMEECLRYACPVMTSTQRWAIEKFSIGDKDILPGEEIILVISSANRDESIFNEPESLNITRENNPHLAFGHGPHLCLGNALGRMEFKTIMQILIKRLPNIRLAIDVSEIKWHPYMLFRALEKLPVNW